MTSKKPNTFCIRLKQARLVKGLSQKNLGILAGLDEFTASTRINRYEQGIHKVDPSFASRLASVLAVPLSYLYEEDDTMAQIILGAYSLDELGKLELLRYIERTSLD